VPETGSCAVIKALAEYTLIDRELTEIDPPGVCVVLEKAEAEVSWE
jgi:hypothetical protein